MDLGVESMQLVEMVGMFEKEMDIELYPTLFFEYANVREPARFFASEHGGVWERYFREHDFGAFSPKVRRKEMPAEKPAVKQETNTFKEARPIDFMQKPSSFRRREGKQPVAVIGMAGVFAGSSNVNTFRHHLYRQTDLIEKIPRTISITGPGGDRRSLGRELFPVYQGALAYRSRQYRR